MMWIDPKGDKQMNTTLMSLGRSQSNDANTFEFVLEDSGFIGFHDFDGTNHGFDATSARNVSTGKRTHVAFSRSQSMGSFFIDGAPAGTVKPKQFIPYLNGPLCVGGDYRTEHYFIGDMDHVAIFSVALRPELVAQIYYKQNVSSTF